MSLATPLRAFFPLTLTSAASQAAALVHPREGCYTEQDREAEEPGSKRSRTRADQFGRACPLNADVIRAAVARRRIQTDDSWHDDRNARVCDATRRTTGRLSDREQLFGRRDDILHFERILLANVNQRHMFAVLGAI